MSICMKYSSALVEVNGVLIEQLTAGSLFGEAQK